MQLSKVESSVSSASADGARTAEIRQTAARLFEASGYSATTMTDIANAVGILPGSLYHHFASKEELALEILEEFHLAVHQVVATTDASDTSQSSRERIGHLANQLTALSLSHAAAGQFRAFEAPTVATPRLAEALRRSDPGLAPLWRRAVKGLLPEGDSREADLGLLRFALNEMTMNAAVNTSGLGATTVPATREPSRISQLICDLVLDGITVDCPDDDELDASRAMAAAREGTLLWPPSQPRADDTRGEIIAAARTLFASRGYDATTIRDVADAAGVRMGTLYRRIDSKEELLSVILQDYSHGVDSAMVGVLTAENSVPATLDGLAYLSARAKRRFREESDIVKLGYRGKSFELAPFQVYGDETRKRLRLQEKLLARGVAEGSIRGLGAPAEVGPLVRAIMWLPFQDYAQTTLPRTDRFLRRSLLRGFATAD